MSAHFKTLLPSQDVSSDDFLCSKCFERISTLTLPEEVVVSQDEDEFTCAEKELDSLNQSAIQVGVSPIKKPWSVKSSHKRYAGRKRKQLNDALCQYTKTKLTKVFKVEMPSSKETKIKEACETCKEYISNINLAVESCKSYNEKVQVLTIIPSFLSKKMIMHNIPSVSKYMVDKTRKVRSNKGVFGEADPYYGKPVKEADITIAQSFYLEDKWDCSYQSANKKDNISITIKGEKMLKLKRYMTRSIKETFDVYKKEYPISHIGRSKFYALRPKWVVPNPPRDVCLCVYCANFELCLVTLKNMLVDVTYETLITHVKSLVVCDVGRNPCMFQECGDCPGKGGLNIQTLDLKHIADDSSEVTYAIWEDNKLIKKTVAIDTYIDKLGKWTVKAVTHHHLKKVQQQHISDVKERVQLEEQCLVLHCDFAENWSVILPQEIQGYHWINDQVSLFTGVTYFQQNTTSVAVISDDTGHDSAHALLAIRKILQQLPSQPEKIIISDGAPSHFKNRYQLYELSKSPVPMEWVYSATGHGKGPCDGVGGMLKHHATKHNLSRPSTAAIQNAEEFARVVQNYSSTTLIMLAKEELNEFWQKKVEEWSTHTTHVKGIQKTHVWSQIDGRTYIARTEKSKREEITFIHPRPRLTWVENIQIHNLQRGMFVACVYDCDWWVAEVIDVSCELNEITVNFMIPHGPAAGYRFPVARQQLDHQCSLPIRNVLRVVSAPVPIGSTGRHHSMSQEDTDAVEHIFNSWHV